jgi:hypothetical protein
LIGEPLDQRVASKDNSKRFQPLDKESRKKLAQSRQEVERSRDERRKVEVEDEGRVTEKLSKESAPFKVKRVGSPIVAKPFTEAGQDDSPPKIYESPKTDLKVAPKPRGEAKDKSRGDAKDKPRGDAKDQPRGEAKDKPRGDAKDKPRGEAKDQPRGEAKDQPRGEAKDKPRGEAKDGPSGESKSRSKK